MAKFVLPPKLEAYVKAKLASGMYASEGEVIAEALRVAMLAEGVQRSTLEALKFAEIEKYREQ
jgi:Arc/MetJ-type ribon-helix-helix transcriptional regulator